MVLWTGYRDQPDCLGDPIPSGFFSHLADYGEWEKWRMGEVERRSVGVWGCGRNGEIGTFSPIEYIDKIRK